MSNVIYVRPQIEGVSRHGDGEEVAQGIRAGLNRLLACARGAGLDNTAMMIELALTAVEVDVEDRRR